MSWKDEIERDWGVGCCVHVYPCRVVVEGHKGLLSYTPECVKIKRRKGAVCIAGCDLAAEQVDREELVVVGRIDRVEWV